MTELLQFLIVLNHEWGALHQDVATFADPAEAATPTTSTALPPWNASYRPAEHDAARTGRLIGGSGC